MTEPSTDPTPTFGRTGRLDDTPADPDVAPVAAANPLDFLRLELAEEVTTDDLVLDVPGRPGYAVRYGTVVRFEEVEAWRKRASDKKGNADALRLGAIILANRCHAIIRNGVELEVDGEVVTFAHDAILEATGTHRAVDAVVAFYGRDPHVLTAADAVLAEAGFGDVVSEADELDPTTRS